MPNEGKLFAYAGKILRIHLRDGRIFTEPTEQYAQEWPGGNWRKF